MYNLKSMCIFTFFYIRQLDNNKFKFVVKLIKTKIYIKLKKMENCNFI